MRPILQIDCNTLGTSLYVRVVKQDERVQRWGGRDDPPLEFRHDRMILRSAFLPQVVTTPDKDTGLWVFYCRGFAEDADCEQACGKFTDGDALLDYYGQLTTAVAALNQRGGFHGI